MGSVHHERPKSLLKAYYAIEKKIMDDVRKGIVPEPEKVYVDYTELMIGVIKHDPSESSFLIGWKR